MKITFLGAAGEVTGSCHLVETSTDKYLVDYGLFQGAKEADEKNRVALPVNSSQLTAVFVTHAHLDHIGRLPLLVRGGFKGKVYMTPPTIEIAKLLLLDTVKIMSSDSRHRRSEPLYTKQEMLQLFDQVVAVEYDQPVKVKGAEATFHDAGHILGSAFIKLISGGKTVVFSGDLGNHPAPFHRFAHVIPDADYVVMESTYGNLLHEDPRERLEKLKAAITRTVKNKGVLMIPTFAVDRSQELLYEIDKLRHANLIPPITIFMDSPLAIKVTQVYSRYIRYFNTEARRLAAAGDKFFAFPELISTLKPKDSLQIEQTPPPKIIIAGSGMLHGGRILRHVARYLPDPNSELLFIGYQAQGTLGRQLFEGAKIVKIERKQVSVKARVSAIGAFSGHADQAQLISWLTGSLLEPKQVFLVHGEPDAQKALAEIIRTKLSCPVITPAFQEAVEL